MASKSLLTLGIDEAGRGPALGPMVVACCVVTTSVARLLTRAGVGDSKQYGSGDKAQRRRRELADLIRAEASFAAVEVAPVADIDTRVWRGELNVLEREMAARLIADAPVADRIVCDGAAVFGPLVARLGHGSAHDRGEGVHVAVAAASVLAKVERDEQFAAICERYAAEFGLLRGGGYVNDHTLQFLQAYVDRYGRLPIEARRSWPYPALRGLPRQEVGQAQAELF